MFPGSTLYCDIAASQPAKAGHNQHTSMQWVSLIEEHFFGILHRSSIRSNSGSYLPLRDKVLLVCQGHQQSPGSQTTQL